MMKKAIPLFFMMVFLAGFASAQFVSTNTTYFIDRTQSHSPNSVEGVLFRADANKTLVSITRSPLSNAPFCVVFDSQTNATLVNSTWINNVCQANNASLIQGRLYRIGTGTNTTTAYQTTFNNTYYGGFNGSGDLKYYPGIGNFTGGCYGETCNIYAIASTMYNIVGLNLSEPSAVPQPGASNMTVENLTARIIHTQNISVSGSGFFNWLGSAVNKITKGWFEEIDVNIINVNDSINGGHQVFWAYDNSTSGSFCVNTQIFQTLRYSYVSFNKGPFSQSGATGANITVFQSGAYEIQYDWGGTHDNSQGTNLNPTATARLTRNGAEIAGTRSSDSYDADAVILNSNAQMSGFAIVDLNAGDNITLEGMYEDDYSNCFRNLQYATRLKIRRLG